MFPFFHIILRDFNRFRGAVNVSEIVQIVAMLCDGIEQINAFGFVQFGETFGDNDGFVFGNNGGD